MVLAGDQFSVHRGSDNVRVPGRVLRHGPEERPHASSVLLQVDLCIQLERTCHGELTSTSNIGAPKQG